VFGVLINNTDDHLRNHGFLYQAATGWLLSPAYDLNPMPVDLAPRALTTAIDLDDTTASLELVLSTADDYGIHKDRGVVVIQEMVAAVEGWAAVAKSCGLNNSQSSACAVHLSIRTGCSEPDHQQNSTQSIEFSERSGSTLSFALGLPLP
jgi:hypothetical protein